MSVYCKSCVHLNEQKKRCDKHNKKLTYAKHTGRISFTVFEKCAACNIDDIVDAPAVSLAAEENAGEVLLKFYRALGWNGRDYLDPNKIRTTKAVYCWVNIENGKIKDSEKDRLRDHYNRFIGKPAASGNNAGQQSYGGAANQQQRNNTQDAPQNQPPQQSGSGEYDYQVQAIKESGNSKCLKLLSKKGAQIIAYAPLNNPLKSGARIKNANLEKKQADFGDYYLMHAYEMAA